MKLDKKQIEEIQDIILELRQIKNRIVFALGHCRESGHIFSIIMDLNDHINDNLKEDN